MRVHAVILAIVPKIAQSLVVASEYYYYIYSTYISAMTSTSRLVYLVAVILVVPVRYR